MTAVSDAVLAEIREARRERREGDAAIHERLTRHHAEDHDERAELRESVEGLSARMDLQNGRTQRLEDRADALEAAVAALAPLLTALRLLTGSRRRIAITVATVAAAHPRTHDLAAIALQML